MSASVDPSSQSLDPVVVVALEHLSEAVYQRRRRPLRFIKATIRVLRYFNRRQFPSPPPRDKRLYNMLDEFSRSCVISAFRDLHHHGYSFPPFRVRRWALAHGWTQQDAQLLDDYAAGVIAGVAYHHSNPYGWGISERWKAEANALHREPWIDPGRPMPSNHFVLSASSEVIRNAEKESDGPASTV